MKRILIASIIVLAPTLAFAISQETENKYFVTVDTVGNCSVSQGKPSAGQKTLGEEGGYDSMEVAEKKLEEVRKDEDT